MKLAISTDIAEGVVLGHLTPRPDGRFDVSNTGPADTRWGCAIDGWCILNDGHYGACDEDRDTLVDETQDPYAGSRHVVKPWFVAVRTAGEPVRYAGPAGTEAQAARQGAEYAAKLNRRNGRTAVSIPDVTAQQGPVSEFRAVHPSDGTFCEQASTTRDCPRHHNWLTP